MNSRTFSGHLTQLGYLTFHHLACFQGDRRGLNPRQLEPQSGNNAVSAGFSARRRGQERPRNAVSGPRIRTVSGYSGAAS